MFCNSIISGFEEKGGVREFLFALPRLANDQVSTIHAYKLVDYDITIRIVYIFI